MTRFFVSILLLCCFAAHSQTVKQVPAVRTNLPITLDGIPDEEAWKQAPVIADFVEMRPHFGRTESPESKTTAYLLYDDDFVYFGGYNRERTRDSVATQLAGRDEIGVNDFIGIVFDTYQDKINGLGFYVTALNEQFDMKYAIGDEDGSWNAVYHTKQILRIAGGHLKCVSLTAHCGSVKKNCRTGIFIFFAAAPSSVSSFPGARSILQSLDL